MVGTSIRRILTSVAAWVVGAVASVAVGMLALSVIDSGPAIHAEPIAPLVAPEAGNYPAADTSSGTSSSAVSPAASSGTSHPAAGSPTVPVTSRQFNTDGGTVLARCTGSTIYLVSWSPAQDYRVGRVHRGPGTDADVTFLSHSRVVEIQLQCVSWVPQATVNWGGAGDD